MPNRREPKKKLRSVSVVETRNAQQQALIEKATAEGLPPGWIKEFKVHKKGGKVRRDPYYIDDATGYIFHSMKDVLHYSETGDLRRLASKPKDKGNDDVELDDDNASPAAVGKKQKIADAGDHNKKLSSKYEVMELSCADLRKSKDPEEKEKQTDLPPMESLLSPAVGAIPEKESVDTSSKKRPCRRPKNKRISNLPRRTSKRLSGVEVDPGLQIKPNVRVAKDSKQKTPATATSPSMGKHARKLETESKGLEMKICSSMLAQGGNPDDEKSQSFNLPFDIFNDPCIEFAIKTLTGTAFDAVEAMQVLAGSKCGEKLAVEQQFPIHSGKEFQPKNREIEKAGPPLDLPCKEFWTDPCIEFAVKTLTGAIPLEYDMNMHGLSKQLSSSQTQGNNELSELTLSRV